MKKIIFILLTVFSFSSLNADYLKLGSNYCVTDYYYYDDSLYFYKSSEPDTLIVSTTLTDIFVDGYVYDPNTFICSLDPISESLGIQYHEYKFLMGLMGLLLGFGFLFPILLIFSRR